MTTYKSPANSRFLLVIIKYQFIPKKCKKLKRKKGERERDMKNCDVNDVNCGNDKDDSFNYWFFIVVFIEKSINFILD